MSEDNIILPVEGTGKKLRALKETVGLNEVFTQVMGAMLLDSQVTGAAYGLKWVDGKPRISSTPYNYDIAEGNIVGHKTFAKLGYNPLVVNVEEDVWTVGGKYVFPLLGQQMELVSTSPNDAAGNTGIQELTIYYLDTDYIAHTEDKTLDGTNVVTTTATDIYRVNAMRAKTVGTAGAAVGTINLRHLTDSPIYRSISPGYTRGRGLIYTVPATKTLFINQVSASSVASASGHYARFIFRAQYDDALNAKVPFMSPWADFQVQDGFVPMTYETPISIPEKCDVVGSVIGEASNSNLSITASWRGHTE